MGHSGHEIYPFKNILTVTAQELNTNNKKILPVKEEKIKFNDEEIEQKLMNLILTKLQKEKNEAVKKDVKKKLI